MLLKDLLQNSEFDCNCRYAIYDVSDVKGTGKTWHDIQPTFSTLYNVGEPPGRLLEMKINYITIDTRTSTLVIEVGS